MRARNFLLNLFVAQIAGRLWGHPLDFQFLIYRVEFLIWDYKRIYFQGLQFGTLL